VSNERDLLCSRAVAKGYSAGWSESSAGTPFWTLGAGKSFRMSSIRCTQLFSLVSEDPSFATKKGSQELRGAAELPSQQLAAALVQTLCAINSLNSQYQFIRDQMETETAPQSAETVEDEIVKLDVGGRLFKTRKSTLLRSPYFSAMFSGSFAEKDGRARTMFLDRSAILFEEVLRILRDPSYEPSAAARSELAYFGLSGKPSPIKTITLDRVLVLGSGGRAVQLGAEHIAIGFQPIPKFSGQVLVLEPLTSDDKGDFREAHIWYGRHWKKMSLDFQISPLGEPELRKLVNSLFGDTYRRVDAESGCTFVYNERTLAQAVVDQDARVYERDIKFHSRCSLDSFSIPDAQYLRERILCGTLE
jgi:hypothetical protein